MLAGLLKTLFPSRFPSRDAQQMSAARLEAWDGWLAPLSGDAGTGRDPGYEDAFFELGGWLHRDLTALTLIYIGVKADVHLRMQMSSRLAPRHLSARNEPPSPRVSAGRWCCLLSRNASLRLNWASARRLR